MPRPRASLPLLALALPLAGLAQSPPPSQPPTFTERVEVLVRNVDVVVSDRDGNPIVGLAREDFELLENGKPVPIVNFAAYREGGDADLALEGGAVLTEAAAAEPARSRVLAAPPATWVLHVDQAQLEPKQRNEIVKQLRRFVATALRPGDRTMVTTYDGISLRILSQLTTDVAATDQALAKLEKSSSIAATRLARRHQLRLEIIDSEVNVFEADRVLWAIQDYAEAETVYSRNALSAFHDLIVIVGGIDGRVNVVSGGGGFSSQPAEEFFRLYEVRFRGFNVQELDSRRTDPTRIELQTGFAKLTRAVNSSRVTIHTIYAGSERGPAVHADDGGGFEGFTPSDIVTQEGSAALASFAASTGGRSFVAAPDLARRLGTARNDTVHYYSLGYEPPRLVPGESRRVEVRVNRPGARVLHRQQLAEKKADELAGEAALSALLGETEPDPFGTRLVVGTATGKRREQRVPVEVQVPLTSVTLLPEKERYRGQLLFQFALRSPDGGYRRLEPRPIALEIPADRVGQAMGQHVTMKVDIAVEPGDYRLAVSVLDELSGVHGTTSAALVATGGR